MDSAPPNRKFHSALGQAALMAALLTGVAGTAAAQTNLTNYVPGTTYWGRSNYTEYIAGNLPLIISAPHGGEAIPSELPNRTNSTNYTIVTDIDINTDNLARALRTAAFNRFGRYPHVIICNVHRRKVDCNRDIIEGAQSNTNTQTLWREFHEFIQISRRSVSNNYGRGLYIDLHGHGNPIERNEIGYDLSDTDLFKANLTTSDEDASTIRALGRRSRQSFDKVVRGELSLGALLEQRGYPSVPSPSNPNQGISNGVTNVYFNGGYNVQVYGTSQANGGSIDAIQIECNYDNIRDSSNNRARFASNFIASLDDFFKYHLEMELDTLGPPPTLTDFSDKVILEDSVTSTSNITLTNSNNILWGESSQANVVNASGFIFGGAGTNRTLVVSPRPNAFGTNVIIMVYQQSPGGGIGTGWYYLTVTPVNDRPVYDAGINNVINPGFNLFLTNQATDVDGDDLTYQLVSGPSNAAVHATTGTLTWRPTIAQSGQTYSLVTRVTDNGTNALSATNTNILTVNAAQIPAITSSWTNLTSGSNTTAQLRMSVSGQIGPDYIIQASTNLSTWQSIATNTPSLTPFLWADTNAGIYPQRFYRIRLGP